MFRYNGKNYETWMEVEQAVMVDHPEALDDDLCDLCDMLIEDTEDY